MNTKNKPTRFQIACTLAAFFVLCWCVGMAAGASMNALDVVKMKWRQREQTQPPRERTPRNQGSSAVVEIENHLGGRDAVMGARKIGTMDAETIKMDQG